MSKKGVMICNIGTPKHHDPESVGIYLNEFLMDAEVINIPYVFRYILVRWIIVPRRKSFSAKNYKNIWTEEGSPLLTNTEKLRKNLQAAMGEDTIVQIGMRYSEPSIRTAMNAFKAAGVTEMTVLPLYPQYARATTESTFLKVDEINAEPGFQFAIKKIKAFYKEPQFIAAIAERTVKALEGHSVDHYLMTYHGLPEQQNRRMRPAESYKQQCIETSELIAAKLGLRNDQYSVSFQSRLGRAEWIRPYTDATLEELAERGIKNLAVLCPSFVSDCLETIDEIGVEGKNIFQEAGGEQFHLIPCLNERADYLLGFL